MSEAASLLGGKSPTEDVTNAYFLLITLIWLPFTYLLGRGGKKEPSKLSLPQRSNWLQAASAYVWNYLELIRLQVHLSFWFVQAGAVYAAVELQHSAVWDIIALYVLFNVLLYGGIYMMNAITDAAEDAAHPVKCQRPVASGRVPRRRALVIMVFSWILALTGAQLLWGTHVTSIFVAFLLINVFYSLYAREVPGLDTLVNAMPYGLRVYLGAVVAGLPCSLGEFSLGALVGAIMHARRRTFAHDYSGFARASLRKDKWNLQRCIHIGCFLVVLLMHAAAVLGRANWGYLSARMVAMILGLTAWVTDPQDRPAPAQRSDESVPRPTKPVGAVMSNGGGGGAATDVRHTLRTRHAQTESSSTTNEEADSGHDDNDSNGSWRLSTSQRRHVCVALILIVYGHWMWVAVSRGERESWAGETAIQAVALVLWDVYSTFQQSRKQKDSVAALVWAS